MFAKTKYIIFALCDLYLMNSDLINGPIMSEKCDQEASSRFAHSLDTAEGYTRPHWSSERCLGQ